MNYFDAVLLIPLLWGAWRGFQRGLIFEIAMIIGLILGLYLAFKFSVLFEGFVSKHISTTAVHYISFFLVFVLVILIMILLAKLFESILKIGNLTVFNKVSGALFGIGKYLLITSIILTLFRPVDDHLKLLKPEWKTESVLYSPIVKASQFIFPALSDVKDVFEKKL